MWILGPLILSLQAALAVLGDDQPRIIDRPMDVRVPLNGTVRLACRVSVLPYLNVNWIKNGFGIGDTRKKIQKFNARYALPYNIKEGRYDLQIQNVRLWDDGKYRCQATARGAPVLSRLATLYVLVPALAPVLTQIKPMVRDRRINMSRRAWVEDGRELILECTAKNGRPGAQLSWSIDGQYIRPQNDGKFIHNTIVGSITERSTKDKRLKRLVTRISKFKATFNKLHHDKTITCSAKNEGYGPDLRQPPVSTKLEVRYKPSVLMRIYPHRANNTFEENEEIKISCEADGRPSSYHWQWKVLRGGRSIDKNHIVESWYRLRVKREMNGQIFRCTAMNYGAGHAEVRILVKYPPGFVVPGSALFSASIGGSVTLTCAVRSNPPPSIEWFRRGSNIVLGRKWKLERTDIRQSDFGPYTCRASAGPFSPIEKTVFLEMRGPPYIKPNTVSYGINGRTGKVLCHITAVPLPKPKDVLWFRNGQRLSDQGRYSIKVDSFLRGVKAYLYITQLTASDYGTYNCTVANAVGRDTKLVTLLPQESLSVAFISGMAIAVTVALVIIIIVLCQCRRNSTRRRLYKQAERQPKSGPGDGLPVSKITDEQELVFRPSATVTVASPPILEAPWRNKEALATATLPPVHPNASLSLGHPLGRYDFDERSVLRNGTVLRYKGIDLSPPPSTLHATIVEEDEAYKEDSARSYDSGYSPGPGFTNLFGVAVSGPPAVSFAQHGLLLPPHSLPLSYVPISTPHMVAGLRAESVLPSGGGVVNCHSTNV